jgi:hypothetical protein
VAGGSEPLGRIVTLIIQERRQSEISQQHMSGTLSAQDALRPHVPMHDAMRVHGVEGSGDRRQKPARVRDSEPRFLGDALREAPSLHVLHDQVRRGRNHVAYTVDRDDVGVRYAGQRAGFPEKPGQASGVSGRRGVQCLDGYQPLQGRLASQVDR